MMYKNKFVVCVKHNGQVLREVQDAAYIPFGSEYSIYLRNLENKRAVAKVSIDGKNVSGGGIVINPHSSLDLERFIDTNDFVNSQGNKFKFIERTKQIENFGGISPMDGIIVVEVQFEDNITSYLEPQSHFLSSTRSVQTKGISNDVGITVAGSKSTQSFRTIAPFDLLPERHTIALRLKGETADNIEIREPVTVKSRKQCNVCGHINSFAAKYCEDCGKSLIKY